MFLLPQHMSNANDLVTSVDRPVRSIGIIGALIDLPQDMHQALLDFSKRTGEY